MVEIKRLSTEAIPAALDKAKHYRLLNEADEAESICLDILAADPDHQEALKTLLLALTDKFADGDLSASFEAAREIVDKLDDTHCKAYYSGVIFERRAKYHLKQGGPGAGTAAHGWFVKALDAYGEALTSCDPDNQGAILRWNSCARILNTHPEIQPDETRTPEPLLDSF